MIFLTSYTHIRKNATMLFLVKNTKSNMGFIADSDSIYYNYRVLSHFSYSFLRLKLLSKVKLTFLRKPWLMHGIIFIYIFSLQIPFASCDTSSLDWDQQWIQNAPLEKQPEWFRNNAKDPRSLYEQMNGPKWRDVHDYYNIENGNTNYLGYGWWNSDSASSSSNTSEFEDSSDTNSTPSDNFEPLSPFYHLTPQQILKDFGQNIVDCTEQDIVMISLEYVKALLPKDILPTTEEHAFDHNSPLNKFIDSLVVKDKLYNSREVAEILHLKAALHVYQMCFLNNYSEFGAVTEIYWEAVKSIKQNYDIPQ